MNNNYTPTGVEQTEKWSAHQDMLRAHVVAKQARRELHKRTGGRKFKYPGFLY